MHKSNIVDLPLMCYTFCQSERRETAFWAALVIWRAIPAKIHLLKIYTGHIQIYILNFKYIYSNLQIYILSFKNISSKL